MRDVDDDVPDLDDLDDAERDAARIRENCEAIRDDLAEFERHYWPLFRRHDFSFAQGYLAWRSGMRVDTPPPDGGDEWLKGDYR